MGKDLKSLIKGDEVLLDKVLWVKDLRNNLFSITKAVNDGGMISNEGDALVVKYPDGREIRFDYKVKTKKGFVMAAII